MEHELKPSIACCRSLGASYLSRWGFIWKQAVLPSLLCSSNLGSNVQAQDEDFETPMQPMTMMRNALVSTREFCACTLAPA